MEKAKRKKIILIVIILIVIFIISNRSYIIKKYNTDSKFCITSLDCKLLSDCDGCPGGAVNIFYKKKCPPKEKVYYNNSHIPVPKACMFSCSQIKCQENQCKCNYTGEGTRDKFFLFDFIKFFDSWFRIENWKNLFPN